ncbi:MAG TPA: serine protease [Trueperaceae bacterium]|nr:serine protease [Trueperaceae bacterium]
MRLLRPLLLTSLIALASTVMAQAMPREVRLSILQAVVQIIPFDTDADELVGWSGSGTIISPSGYVLTNFHVAGDLDTRRNYEWHTIWVTDPDFTDQPPEFYFWAQYVAGDPTHDLALLKIVEWFDEEPVDPSFVFPHVQVGDSNQLIPGDPITIVGYPGISGSTVTFTAGLMSGWVGENFESGGKQWIKTDGKISHGNSGGGAFDENGYLIGVPTAGRTVKYDELDTEEQAYVRPISLGWALIGPNVPDVARAKSSTGVRASTTPATSAPTPAATEPSGSGVGPCDFCTVAELALGTQTSNVIGGVVDYINFHTYTVTVPAGTPSLTILLDSDHDLDIAVKYGSPVESWADDADWDYRDLTEAPGGAFTIALPTPGVWYVDVMQYYEDEATNYTLSAR